MNPKISAYELEREAGTPSLTVQLHPAKWETILSMLKMFWKDGKITELHAYVFEHFPETAPRLGRLSPKNKELNDERN